MIHVTVAESTWEDCERLAQNMRAKDIEEMRALGFAPHAAARACFNDGIMRTSYFVDGEIAAMTGLGTGMHGSLLGNTGFPYLLTANVVERAPVAFLKEAKKAVNKMLLLKPVLAGETLSDYHGAIRLLQALGFEIGAPRSLGVNGEMFSHFHMERVRWRETI